MKSTLFTDLHIIAAIAVFAWWPANASAQQLQRSEVPRGIFVTDVVPISTAAQAGISRGDIITRVNNRPVTNGVEFVEFLRESNAQAQLALFDRSAKQFRVALVRPDRNGLIGVFGIPTDRLVNQRASMLIVNGVNPGSAAQLAGIVPGDVILSVNGLRVRTTNDFVGAFAFSGPITRISFVSGQDGLLHEVIVPSEPYGRIGAYLVTVPWL